MNNIISAITIKCLLAISFGLLLVSPAAHADFHKAVDAYISRDGATMLAEVKDAADKKNNEGLMLFMSAMNIDASASRQADIERVRASNREKRFVPESQVKTTLSVILTQPQQDELFKALQLAVDNSSVDTQYDFAILLRTFKRPEQKNWSKMHDEFTQKGSFLAKLGASDLATKAELGINISQVNLGFKYLNFNSDFGYGCQNPSKEAICQTKDEVKGYYWLKRALLSYENRNYDFVGEHFGLYSDLMCDLLNKTANGDKNKLRQAYLWCVVGINSGGWSSWSLLDKMNEAGTLKVVAPEAKAFWSMNSQDRERRFEPLVLTDYKELPDLMVEASKELPKEDLPVFSYYYSDYRMSPYLLDIYADGRVNIAFNFLPDRKGDLLTKVSTKTVRNFLKDLKKLAFKSWTLFTTSGQFCDHFDPCIWTYAQVTHREGDNVRKVRILEPAYLAERDYNNVSTLRVAKLNTLIEQYFPTQKIRCEIGNSEGFTKACIARDNRWAVLSKEKPRDKNAKDKK
jgi:hypothetical protein